MGAPEITRACQPMHGAVKAPPAAIMPFSNGPLSTLAGDGFTAATVPGQPFALVAIGNSQMQLGLHVAMDPAELRTIAAGLLEAADYLDGGKGKN